MRTLLAVMTSVVALGYGITHDQELLGNAEAAFRAGVKYEHDRAAAREQFQKAATLFGQLRDRGVRNASLFRNLGSAHFLAGDLPQAILAYRQGLRFAPHDSELRSLLEHARGEVVYPNHSPLGRPPPDHWPPWLPRPPAWLAVTVLILSFALGCLAVTRWFMVRQAGMLGTAVGAFGITVLSAIGLGLQELEIRRDLEFPPVVVAADGVLLRKGNGLSYPPRFETPLHRGVEARLLHVRGDWLQIELAGGEVGWIPREYALVDAP